MFASVDGSVNFDSSVKSESAWRSNGNNYRDSFGHPVLELISKRAATGCSKGLTVICRQLGLRYSAATHRMGAASESQVAVLGWLTFNLLESSNV